MIAELQLILRFVSYRIYSIYLTQNLRGKSDLGKDTAAGTARFAIAG